MGGRAHLPLTLPRKTRGFSPAQHPGSATNRKSNIARPFAVTDLALAWTARVMVLGCVFMYLAMLVGALLPRAGELAFTSTRKGNLDIFLMDVSRAMAVNITRNIANDCCAAWLPDGDRIAFVSWRDGQTASYVMDRNGRHLEAFDERVQYGPMSVSLSPDRQWIAYASVRSGNAEIYVVDTGGRDVRRLTWNEADDFSPRWRPG
jgi:hypothetical protein